MVQRSYKVKSIKHTNAATKNLHQREMYGFVSKYPLMRCGCSFGRIFANVPRRLVFPLKQIVDDTALIDEAHVFLGFTKDGIFMISYTETLEAIDHTGFPTYVYRLHWWLFKFHKKMKKCRTVRLFANEEILTSLQLSYAEWPQEKSKIVVYGWREKSVCYITVAAVPPWSACIDCGQTDDESISTCLKHCFVAHMKHTSVSQLSGVISATGFAIDKLMTLNLGHSIAVYSLGLLPTSSGAEHLPLSSIKRAAYEVGSSAEEIAPPSVTDKSMEVILSQRLNLFSSSAGNLKRIPDYDNRPYAAEFSNTFQLQGDLSQDMFSSKGSQESDSLQSPARESSFSFTSDDSAPNEASTRKCFKCKQAIPAPSQCAEAHQSEDAADPYFDFEPKSIVLLPRQSETAIRGEISSSTLRRQTKDVVCRCHSIKDENCFCNYSKDAWTNTDEKSGTSWSFKSDCSESHDTHVTSAQFKLSGASNQFQGKRTCPYCGSKLDESVKLSQEPNRVKVGDQCVFSQPSPVIASPRNSSKLLRITSVRNTSRDNPDPSLDLNTATPSPSASESSGSIYCTGDAASQSSVKSGSCRKTDGIVSFFETLYGTTSRDEPVLFAEGGLFYGPVTFEGCAGIPLNPVRSDSADKAVAYSQHLVLDVEHVIFDVLRTRCYKTYKFGYLIDYDVEIIDTCPGTRSVLMLIVALLNVSPRKSRSKLTDMQFRHASNFESKTDVLQQFQCFLCWRLQTGRYELVAASPLQAYHETKGGSWNASWAVQTKKAIHRACAVPVSQHRSAYVLNNAPVFHRKSLNLLWDVERMIAICKWLVITRFFVGCGHTSIFWLGCQFVFLESIQ